MANADVANQPRATSLGDSFKSFLTTTKSAGMLFSWIASAAVLVGSVSLLMIPDGFFVVADTVVVTTVPALDDEAAVLSVVAASDSSAISVA